MTAAALRSIATHSTLRGTLQRAKSSPALQATASATPAWTGVPASQRSFVSTVLLTRDAYDAKRVAELKTELKQRGLSTTGKRADLIQRLLKHDQDRAKVLPTASVAGQRHASTAADSTLPEKSQGAVVLEKGGPTIPHPADMEPGQVSANFHDPAVGVVAPEKLEAHANAPGVPPEKTPNVPHTFVVNVPYEPEPIPRQAEIPLLTSYFHPEEAHFEGYADYSGPLAHEPKVRTVSGEETYLGGGISHHQPTFEDSRATQGQSAPSASDPNSFASAFSSLYSSVQKDLGIPSAPESRKSSSSSQRPTTTSQILNSARETLNSVTGRSSSGSSASYSTSTASSSGSRGEDGRRSLNDEERNGAYVLGGIVATGFLLGGLGKQSKRKSEKVLHSIEEAAKQVRKEAQTLSDAQLSTLVERAEAALKK